MAAVVRIKRRRDEDPVESLLISTKRARKSSDMIHNVFKFAGTVTQKESKDLSLHIRKAIKQEKVQKEYQRHQGKESPILSQPKSIHKTESFKVTAKKRALDLDSLADIDGPADKKDKCDDDEACSAEVDKQSNFCLLDAESIIVSNENSTCKTEMSEGTLACNGVAMVREQLPSNTEHLETASSEEDFVYDLYYYNRSDFDFQLFEDVLHIEAWREDMYYGDYRCGAVEEVYDDEDDSNDEDNWRNDYPDEEDFQDDEPERYSRLHDTDEYDIMERLGKGFHIDGDRYGGEDLSSDDEYQAYSTDGAGAFHDFDHSYAFSPSRSYEEYKQSVEDDLSDS